MHIGEIIEADTSSFVAQCPPAMLDLPPDFGSFVKVLPPGVSTTPEEPSSGEQDPFLDAPTPARVAAPDGTIFGIVCFARTGSLQPGRRPLALGLDEARLRTEQPQIFELLGTEFRALSVAHVRSGRLTVALPPRPPRLHGFVYACAAEEVRALTASPDLWPPLVRAPLDLRPDDLLFASLQQAAAARPGERSSLVSAGKQLATLMRDTPDRLMAILRRLDAEG